MKKGIEGTGIGNERNGSEERTEWRRTEIVGETDNGNRERNGQRIL
jgi:hypothetical protein